MAFKHLQRNFLAITPTTTSFCALESRKLQHMAQIQCRAVQSRVDSQLPYLTAGCVCICSNHSRLGFSKIRVSCKPIRLNPESGLGCQFPRNSIVWSSNGGNRLYQRGRGFVNLIYPLSISRHAVTGPVSNCESVARRSFSSKRSFNCEMMNSREYAVAKAWRESEKSKNQKQVNAIPLQGTGDANLFPYKSQGKKIHATLLLAHRKVNGINSAEALFRDGEKAEESIQFGLTAGSEDNIHHSKKKAPARGKKKIQKPSEPPSPGAAKSSKEASLAKSHKKDKNGPPSETAAINSMCNSSIEIADVAVSSKKLPKKSAKSRRKGNSVKETDVGGKANEASLKVERDAEQLSSSSESSQTLKQPASRKSKPQKANSFKPLYPPQGKSVVVVESHTKAKVIQGYLGDMYEVLPSNGHVRDLAARSGSVRPDEDFSMVWEVPSPAWTHLNNIKTAVIGADNLILASDPDREGEAIAWHIIEMLKQQDSLHDNITVARVVFQEITESAIKTALLSPRDVDVNLVHAYLARRALDYLIGFNISPLLWRKLPGCQSAGRVQSAALSLISDREIEIDEFKPQEYWTIGAIFKAGSSAYSIESYLTHFGSKKVNQMSVGSETEAKKMEQIINSSTFTVIASRRSQINRNPPTPYITSTLQQDAANKLNFSAAYTMKLAQKLYEGVELSHGKATGLITYMRTDGLRISDEAVKGIRDLVVERYGQPFASESPRKYFRKVKNAQEAHEAVRPTDIRRLPSTLAGTLDEDALKLYALIWSRTMACQMESAKIDQIQLDISNDDKAISLRAVGSRLKFLGYRAVYEDVEVRAIRDSDNESSGRDEAFMILSNLKEGDSLCLDKVALEQHHTQPPPRFSEASLVKKLEELGIGRPSTYAMILKVLKDRNYVTMKSRVLYPEFRGRMVSAFLSHHFSEVTDYSFTADMETELDNVSAGLTEWKGLLKDYWTRFSTYCERASKVHIHQVEKLLERTFEDFLFSSLPDANRTCPSCYEGTLIFKVSRFGAGYFIGCDQHPRCKYIAKTIYGDEEEDITPSNNTVEEPKVLGLHPISQEKILLKSGPYGNYVQLGEDRKGYLPKRASVSQIKDAGSITVEEALDLLRYPITLGNHPKDGQPVVLKLAKLGFSIRYRRHIAPVPKNLKASDITFEKALELLKGDNVKQCGRPKTKKRTKDAVEAF